MSLTEPQVKAMLELGGRVEGHDYIPQRVLNDLLSYGFIYFRTADDPEFTPEGREVFDQLARSAGVKPTATAISPGPA